MSMCWSRADSFYPHFDFSIIWCWIILFLLAHNIWFENVCGSSLDCNPNSNQVFCWWCHLLFFCTALTTLQSSLVVVFFVWPTLCMFIRFNMNAQQVFTGETWDRTVPCSIWFNICCCQYKITEADILNICTIFFMILNKKVCSLNSSNSILSHLNYWRLNCLVCAGAERDYQPTSTTAMWGICGCLYLRFSCLVFLNPL